MDDRATGMNRRIPATSAARGRGQVLVLFAASMTLLLLMMAIVVDISWLWVNSLRIQRAADAAALAGAVTLPADPGRGVNLARKEATKNGYTASADVVVAPAQDTRNSHRMNVSITAPVNTYFMRLIGFETLMVTRRASAEFSLPIPMGSPQNYYGLGQFQEPVGGGTTSVQRPIAAPDGTPLAPQNFWGAMQSQGSPMFQGDAYMAGFAERPSTPNPAYDADEYYNYAVEIPDGAANGEVWIFDPGFCATGTSDDGSRLGTGEFWTGPEPLGADTHEPITARYELWNTQETPYDRSDDTLLADSGRAFRRLALTDPTFRGVNDATVATCETLAWHNDWWRLASGLGPGVYRVHTTSKPADASDDQRNSTAVNAFAVWSKASGGTPRVYGIGAMEAYFPLPAGRASTFYLAQIDGYYAGRWVDIDLWDPGDTNALSADLEILMPTATGYAPASFYWASLPYGQSEIPDDFACGPSTSGLVSSIRTSNGTGGSGVFNGQWLRLCVLLPDSYTGPQPPGEPGAGWWKIRYTMGGTLGAAPSTDLTTWRIAVRGNPVHLVVS